MRVGRAIAILLLLVGPGLRALAEDALTALTVEAAADAVLKAVEARDDVALKALAERNDPDPWLVADELCFRGEWDAAADFANEAPRTVIEKLATYVTSQREQKPDVQGRELLARIDAAFRSGDLEEAVEAADALGWLMRAGDLLHESGSSAYQWADWRLAVTLWTARLELAEAMEARGIQCRTLGNLGWIHRARGDCGRALLVARRGLGDEEGATARTQHTSLFAVGALAAARLEDPAEVLTFLESGRSGALLESLGAGRAIRFTDVPEELLEAEARARAVEARARYEYGRALDSGNRREIRRRARTLDDAMERGREVTARIQREANRVAALFYPRASTLEEIQDWLEEGEALVLYGLCLGEALALVMRREEAPVRTGRAAGSERCRQDGADLTRRAALLLALRRTLPREKRRPHSLGHDQRAAAR